MAKCDQAGASQDYKSTIYKNVFICACCSCSSKCRKSLGSQTIWNRYAENNFLIFDVPDLRICSGKLCRNDCQRDVSGSILRRS